MLDDKGCGGGSNEKIINEEREGVRVNYNELEKRGSSKRSKSLLSKGCVRLQVLSLHRALARQDTGTAKVRWSVNTGTAKVRWSKEMSDRWPKPYQISVAIIIRHQLT